MVTILIVGDKMNLDIPIGFGKRLVIGVSITVKEVEVMGKITNAREAEKRAAELYDEHFNATDAIFKGRFATDLPTILQKLGIKIVIRSLKDYEGLVAKPNVSGYLWKNGNEFAIFLEEKDSLERKRFTIAHEIAHKVLNHIDDNKHVSIFFRDEFSAKGVNAEEIAANAFAATLLMPEKIIRHVYTLTSDVAMTARYLGVSDTAARIRLDNLGIL